MICERDAPIKLGSRLELLVDDELIDHMEGAALRLHRPIPAGVALAFDQPWEGPTSTYASVVEDDGRFRLYYRGSPAAGAPAVTCLAESVNGIHWTRSRVGLYCQTRWPQNNIVWAGEEAHNLAPFRDTNPHTTADARYKALGGRPPRALASPDGIHWRHLCSEALFTDGRFDSQNVAFWHPVEGCYVGYVRYWRNGKRWIARIVSDDFLHWSTPEPVDAGSESRDDLYTSVAAPYSRAPHLLLAFPQRFLPQRQVVADAPLRGVSDSIMMTSRDGRMFQRTFKEAFVRPGPDWRNWSDRSNMVAWGMARTGKDELSLYVTRHYRYTTAHLERCILRLDGFGSISASDIPGEVISRPLCFAGRVLHLNYATSAAGSVRVEIQTQDGLPAPNRGLKDCDELVGDKVDGIVRWHGEADLGFLAGAVVRLRFELCDADVYSLRFGT
jgi:hypothetical protein